MNILIIFCLLIGCLIDQVFCGVLVHVEQGWLSGDVRHSVVNQSVSYYSFKGIPYAKPPVGPLRFKDPQFPEPWNGIRNATEHGAKCPQVILGTSIIVPSNEDCLFLNVYTPKLGNDTLMPVLVFIHGGGFQYGSGNDDDHGPDILITKGIVLVTFNYRLEGLGFLCLDNADVPGNAGLKDQVFALRWVQRNIRNFGGDPSQVTLQGQSAGGAAVTMHVLSPMSKGLFRRAQIFSGTLLSDWASSYYAKRRALGLTQDLGLVTRNVTEAVSYLRNLTSDKLINLSTPVLASEVGTEYPTRFIPFVAVVEKDFGQERFITMSPLEALQAGNLNVKEIVIGYTDQEMVTMMDANEAYMKSFERYPEMFVPRPVMDAVNASLTLDLADEIQSFYYGDKSVKKSNMMEFINFSSNMSFVYNIHRFLKRIPYDVDVYFYKFGFYTYWNFYSDFGKSYNITGAAHTDDLLYLWYSNAFNKTLSPNTTEYELVSIYSELCANFVKFGNPTPNAELLGFTWPKYNVDTREYLDAQNILSIGRSADERDVEFWESIYHKAGLTF